VGGEGVNTDQTLLFDLDYDRGDDYIIRQGGGVGMEDTGEIENKK
jgi:hypothetical protein